MFILDTFMNNANERISFSPKGTTTTSEGRRDNVIDAELEQILSQQKATIKVIGAGGAGNNTITRITEVGVKGAECIAINTDAQDLLYSTADKKILISMFPFFFF